MELRLYLDQHELPIAVFAEAVGVSVQTIYRYLHGERIPRASVMDRIILATQGHVTPNDFFTVTEPA